VIYGVALVVSIGRIMMMMMMMMFFWLAKVSIRARNKDKWSGMK
jgi:hypothetical protein